MCHIMCYIMCHVTFRYVGQNSTVNKPLATFRQLATPPPPTSLNTTFRSVTDQLYYSVTSPDLT